MRWSLLISRRQHKSEQLSLSISCTLSLVPLNTMIPSDHHPSVGLLCQKLYPLDVISIAPTRQVFHMMSTMAKMLYESVKCASENRRRAVVEEDLHAANRSV